VAGVSVGGTRVSVGGRGVFVGSCVGVGVCVGSAVVAVGKLVAVGTCVWVGCGEKALQEVNAIPSIEKRMILVMAFMLPLSGDFLN